MSSPSKGPYEPNKRVLQAPGIPIHVLNELTSSSNKHKQQTTVSSTNASIASSEDYQRPNFSAPDVDLSTPKGSGFFGTAYGTSFPDNHNLTVPGQPGTSTASMANIVHPSMSRSSTGTSVISGNIARPSSAILSTTEADEYASVYSLSSRTNVYLDDNKSDYSYSGSAGGSHVESSSNVATTGPPLSIREKLRLMKTGVIPASRSDCVSEKSSAHSTTQPESDK
ncbi:hypothetical protein LJB42_001900 [Komagataella kurtzmanii]|nr:hypothetical protein LJB42_001900 [Komagataella kurtzmanii]